jgi:integral membrane protein (TIGR00529 family)
LIFALVLTAVIVAIRFRVHVAIALFLGGLSLVLLGAPNGLVGLLYETLVDKRTVFLMSMSFAVASLAELYRLTGFVRDLGRSLMLKINSPIINLSFIPAVIGLMPVAGGALMSAPIVDAIGSTIGMNEDMMIFANVWFRHTIFLFYPISNVMVVTSTMSGYPILDIALVQIPASLLMIAIGIIITARKMRGSREPGIGRRISIDKINNSLKRTSAPIIIGVSAAILLNRLFGDFGMPFGVMLGFISLALLSTPSSRELLKSMLNWKVIGITAASYSIMFLQKSISLSGAANSLASLSSSSSVPIELLEVLLPGLLGYATGSTLMGIAVSLPIISSMTSLKLADVSIIFISAYLFYIGSPAHLCLVYTAQYFRRPVMSSYRYLVPAVIATLLLSLTYLITFKGLM